MQKCAGCTQSFNFFSFVHISLRFGQWQCHSLWFVHKQSLIWRVKVWWFLIWSQVVFGCDNELVTYNNTKLCDQPNIDIPYWQLMWRRGPNKINYGLLHVFIELELSGLLYYSHIEVNYRIDMDKRKGKRLTKLDCLFLKERLSHIYFTNYSHSHRNKVCHSFQM